MENTTLLEALYDKMAAEQARYREWLLHQPPSEILDHAYEYSVREDIVMEMEELDLPDAQARALLKSRAPLADIYKAWCDVDTNHMDDIQDVIEARADAVLQAQRERFQREAR